MNPYKRLCHTPSTKLPNTTAERSQFTTMAIPADKLFQVNICVLYLLLSVHSQNKVAFWVWKKSCESSLCIIQPQKYKQILLLGEFGEEAVSRLAESQAIAEGQHTVKFCCSYLVQIVVCWFISSIFAVGLCLNVWDNQSWRLPFKASSLTSWLHPGLLFFSFFFLI